jgi:hypothetical protein
MLTGNAGRCRKARGSKGVSLDVYGSGKGAMAFNVGKGTIGALLSFD